MGKEKLILFMITSPHWHLFCKPLNSELKDYGKSKNEIIYCMRLQYTPSHYQYNEYIRQTKRTHIAEMEENC